MEFVLFSGYLVAVLCLTVFIVVLLWGGASLYRDYMKLQDRQVHVEIEHAAQVRRLEAQIDALMLEYCPEEMSEEQKLRWAKSLRPMKLEGMQVYYHRR